MPKQLINNLKLTLTEACSTLLTDQKDVINEEMGPDRDNGQGAYCEQRSGGPVMDRLIKGYVTWVNLTPQETKHDGACDVFAY